MSLLIEELQSDSVKFSLSDILLTLKIKLNQQLHNNEKIDTIMNVIKNKNPMELTEFYMQQQNIAQSEQQTQVKQDNHVLCYLHFPKPLSLIQSYDEFYWQIKKVVNSQQFNIVQDLFLYFENKGMRIDILLNMPEYAFLEIIITENLKGSLQCVLKIFKYYEEISQNTIMGINSYQNLSLVQNSKQFISQFQINVPEYNDSQNTQLNERLSKLSITQLQNCQLDSFSVEEITTFKRYCKYYHDLQQNAIQIVLKDQLTDNYIGWQAHWESIIKFVSSHIQRRAYQAFDVLLILGGPKSGKSLTMYLVAVFMLSFVGILRHQNSKPFFCQDIVKIIRLDCRQAAYLSLIVKLKWIYEEISQYIFQTDQQKIEVKHEQSLSCVILFVQRLFQKAKCYYIITWDEIQCMFENLSQKEQQTMGKLLKIVMICDSTPCQHIAAGSLSVALLAILKEVPVNGNNFLRCQHAVNTAFQASDLELQLLIDLRYKDQNQNNRKALLETLKLVLKQELSQSCADLDQILKELEFQDITKQILKNKVDKLKQDKFEIALPWVQKSILNLTPFHLSIFELIVGTKIQPHDMLLKLCIEDQQGIFKFRDNNLLRALNTEIENQQVDYEKSILENQQLLDILSIINCGNIISKYNKHGQHNLPQIQLLWSQLIEQNKSKDLQEQLQIEQIQLMFSYYAELNRRNHKLNIMEKDYNNNSVEIKALIASIETYKNNIKNEMNNHNFKNESQSVWLNGCTMIEIFRNCFSHFEFKMQKNTLEELKKVISGQKFTSIKQFFDLVLSELKLLNNNENELFWNNLVVNVPVIKIQAPQFGESTKQNFV
ncbi:P-loop_containing nucleoside triphosphate hydrolase [Hexamita inflata]|uniref:P-loop containing nucleoside triphosphate hydrolase n=1 Tax=Hexamita inflata TaxID=28002 RepID=A0AA86Q2D0_9EUKA|nr:P-loop containing nucleoside triphosphate hydrolase [Hexamita inflata]